MTTHRSRWRVVSALVVMLALSVSVSAADARPGSAHRSGLATTDRMAAGSAAARASAGSAKSEYGIPPIADADPNTGNPVPYKGTAVTATQSSKAKVTVTLPEIVTSTYANFCLAFPLGGDLPPFETCCPDPTSSPCVKVDPPASSYDSSGFVNWYQITGPTWVNSPAGVKPRFGTFPDVRVKALAFGSVPVTATIHLEQTVGSDGYYDPLDLDYSFSAEFPPGETVDGYGAAPASTFSTGGSFIYRPAHLNGRVRIRLSEVAVDGRAVPVGNDCRTVRPATLTLGSPGGFSPKPASDTPISAFYGRPGSFTTNPGAQLYGNLAIPSFTGCSNGGEDLSRLLTSFVSSDRNPVTVTLTSTLDVCTVGSPGCPVVPTMGTPAVQRAAQASMTSGKRVNTAVLATPGMRTRLIRALSSLPASVRATALASLPDVVRAAVARRLARGR